MSARLGSTSPVGPRLLTLCAVVLAPAGCDDGTVDRGPAVLEVDSAGVAIVTLPALAAAETLELEEAWARGEFRETPVFAVNAVRVLDDGRVAVVQGSSSSSDVHVLDAATGDVRGVVGRAGEGPGEFASPYDAVPSEGGGLAVADMSLRRLSEFGPAGDFRTSRQIPVLGVVGRPELHPDGDDWYLWVSSNLGAARAGAPLQRDEGVLVHWSAAEVDTITRFPGVEYVANGSGMGGPPWGARSWSAPHPDGVWLSDTAKPELRLWDRTGTRRIVRWPAEPVAITEARRDDFMTRIEALAPPGTPSQLMDMMRSLLVVDTAPYWMRVVPGGDGAIWVSTTVEWGLPRQAEGPPPERHWVVLDARGHPVAEATTPAGFDLHDVRGDLAVGVHYDPLDAETVRAYRIRSTGR